ncbi:bacterio-opsin activator domain-containing protein [Saliphagus infecundisoli]|uniref:Bacterio-opsin activator domain-containing protein n=1 Tax=Saliphagus infecundisoli TaxID=1849069 RepID=A0ABD5QDU1_9EURY|nr:bacterio-opsin activator domain-containing protein [Saliphagus infecundisoli]
MANIDGTPGGRGSGEPGAARAALDSLIDPVVAVEEGRLSYANAAAVEAFDLPPDPAGGSAAELAWWTAVEPEIREATIGTAREVSGEALPAPARIHRQDGGATVTFDGDGGPPARDRAVKDRAMNEAPVGITIADAESEDVPLVYANEAFERVTGYPVSEVVGQNCRFLQGEESDPEAIEAMWRAVEEAEPVTVELVNYRKDGTSFWNEVTIAPVREAGELTHFVGFQNDVTKRKRAELALERRTAELEHVLSRIEGLVRDVTAAAAGATDRPTLETAVCERIAEEAGYEGVWIGERDAGRGTIEVRASAGIDPEALPLNADHPAPEAIGEGEARLGPEEAAFPLVHNDVEYGVLVVRGGAIDDRERAILSALSRAVASGINARETSRILETDAIVAVSLRIDDRGFAPAALSAAADCRLEYRRSTHLAEEPAALFTVSGATPGALEDAAANLEGVSVRTVVERGTEGSPELLVELRTEEPGFVEWLSTRGGVVRSISAGDGEADVALELPAAADVRAVVEAIEERHPGTDTRSIRRHERAGETRAEFASRLEADLTDRQLAALRRAYLGGYFEWPRPTTGEDLAESMGVARPTFHEHLRTAERKLCAALFEGDEPGDTA